MLVKVATDVHSYVIDTVSTSIKFTVYMLFHYPKRSFCESFAPKEVCKIPVEQMFSENFIFSGSYNFQHVADGTDAFFMYKSG